MFRKKIPQFKLINLTLDDLHWFIKSMYWLRPMPSNLKPGKKRLKPLALLFLCKAQFRHMSLAKMKLVNLKP